MSGNTLLRDNLTLAVQSFYTAKDSENVSPRTLQAYQHALDNKFIPWLREQGVTDVKQITPSVVRSYFVFLGKQGYSTWTTHDYARPIKTWLRFLYTDDILSTDVMARVKMPKLDKPVLPAFSVDDVQRILVSCETERERTLVLFMLDTGVRAQELCDLTVGDFDVKTGAVLIKRGKGAKGRTVFCDARSRKQVLKYLLSRGNPPLDEPLFPSTRDKSEYLNPNSLLQLFRRLERKSGVANLSPHTFRRTFALFSLRAGMDLFRLAALMGHSDVSVLKQYLDIDAQDLQDAHANHSALNEILGSKRNGKK